MEWRLRGKRRSEAACRTRVPALNFAPRPVIDLNARSWSNLDQSLPSRGMTRPSRNPISFAASRRIRPLLTGVIDKYNCDAYSANQRRCSSVHMSTPPPATTSPPGLRTRKRSTGQCEPWHLQTAFWWSATADRVRPRPRASLGPASLARRSPHWARRVQNAPRRRRPSRPLPRLLSNHSPIVRASTRP